MLGLVVLGRVHALTIVRILVVKFIFIINVYIYVVKVIWVLKAVLFEIYFFISAVIILNGYLLPLVTM